MTAPRCIDFSPSSALAICSGADGSILQIAFSVPLMLATARFARGWLAQEAARSACICGDAPQAKSESGSCSRSFDPAHGRSNRLLGRCESICQELAPSFSVWSLSWSWCASRLLCGGEKLASWKWFEEIRVKAQDRPQESRVSFCGRLSSPVLRYSAGNIV